MIGESDQESAQDTVAEALAAYGLVAVGELHLDEEFWLWPENEETFCLWLGVQSQWNRSDGIPTGLDYPAVQVVMKMRGIRKRARTAVFSDLQVMEAAALAEWARAR